MKLNKIAPYIIGATFVGAFLVKEQIKKELKESGKETDQSLNHKKQFISNTSHRFMESLQQNTSHSNSSLNERDNGLLAMASLLGLSALLTYNEMNQEDAHVSNESDIEEYANNDSLNDTFSSGLGQSITENMEHLEDDIYEHNYYDSSDVNDGHSRDFSNNESSFNDTDLSSTFDTSPSSVDASSF